MAVCGAKPAIDAGIGRGYTGPSSVFFTNDYWPITEAGFQNHALKFYFDWSAILLTEFMKKH